MLDRDQKVTGVSVIARDVTERNRLERQVIESCMVERRRIGHELHDGLAQYLTGLAFRAKSLQQTLEEGHLPAAKEAKELVALISNAISRTRDLARGQDPAEIQNLGLEKALQILSVETEVLFGVSCKCARLRCFRSSLDAQRFPGVLSYLARGHSQCDPAWGSPGDSSGGDFGKGAAFLAGVRRRRGV